MEIVTKLPSHFHSQPKVIAFPALSIWSLSTSSKLSTTPSLPLEVVWKVAVPLSFVVPSASVYPNE